jgi:hypothetical protein
VCNEVVHHFISLGPLSRGNSSVSLHIEKADIGNLSDEVFSSDFRDEAIREAAKPKLKVIREKIMETPCSRRSSTT